MKDLKDSSTYIIRNEYKKRKTQIKKLTDELKELGIILKSRLSEKGVSDENGHLRIFLNGDGEEGCIELQKRLKATLIEDVAISILDGKGLKNEVIDVVEVVNEKKIEELFNAGKIESDELIEMYDEKESTALYVK